jgi:hypothetical protein
LNERSKNGKNKNKGKGKAPPGRGETEEKKEKGEEKNVINSRSTEHSPGPSPRQNEIQGEPRFPVSCSWRPHCNPLFGVPVENSAHDNRTTAISRNAYTIQL